MGIFIEAFTSGEALKNGYHIEGRSTPKANMGGPKSSRSSILLDEPESSDDCYVVMVGFLRDKIEWALKPSTMGLESSVKLGPKRDAGTIHLGRLLPQRS